MRKDIEKARLQNGLFVYSMWGGYRDSDYQKAFENHLNQAGFVSDELYTSGHAFVSDIKRVITELDPKQIIPIHTMTPDSFLGLSDRVVIKEDGKMFSI